MEKFNCKPLLAAVALCGVAGFAHAEDTRVVSPPAMRDILAVEVSSIDGAVIKGRVTNKTPNRVQAPELMAKYNWLWHDDHNPGPDDPGWVTYQVIADELGPNQSREFVIDPGRPLPERDDGAFVTSVAVTRVTEFKLPDAD